MPSCDAIIIGAGPNGLAAAGRLLAAKRRVLVLEAADTVGGGMAGWDFAPGFRTPGLAHVLHLLDPRVETGMDLSRHGLRYASRSLPTVALSATGHHLGMEGIFGANLTGADADETLAWLKLRAQLLKFAAVLAPFQGEVPPRLARDAGNDTVRLARLGLAVRMLGKADFRELLRMLLINVHDVLNDELTHPLLKGVLAFDATLGSWLGPRSPNSLILLLHRLAGEVAGKPAALALPEGGMTGLATAMAASVRASGGEIRTGARVAELVVEADQVAGVRLASGEALHAPLIISAISPKTTLLTLLGPRHLDAGFTTRLRDQKSRGAVARLHLALDRLPDFRGADPKARLVIAPTEDAVERAYNPVKYGEVPEAPVMEITLPSAHGPGFAPEGQHVLSALVQFAPHDPQDRDAARAAMLENALHVLERHAPGLGDSILSSELLMPYDIADRFGMVGGNWHHGELSVEQMLFLRPLPGMAQYQGPLPGLWLASAGCHPGGGISGAAGWNAAGRILKEVRT
jgi:phytoene dehydrogenase-like protein